MSISDIRAALIAELDRQAAEYGENSTLTSQQNVDVTDTLAGTLETVNPNHDYPPRPR